MPLHGLYRRVCGALGPSAIKQVVVQGTNAAVEMPTGVLPGASFAEHSDFLEGKSCSDIR